MTEDLHAKAPDIPEAMTVTLGSYPNPDFPDGRRGPLIKPYRGPCFDLEHAVGRCRRFIASYDLGGGNWVGGVGVVRRGEEVIAFISYNGRIRYAPGPTSGSAAPALYRGYQITLDFDCPLGGYAFCHDAYNGPPDPRCGHGATVAEVVDQIDEIEGEPVVVNLLKEALAHGFAPSQQGGE